MTRNIQGFDSSLDLFFGTKADDVNGTKWWPLVVTVVGILPSRETVVQLLGPLALSGVTCGPILERQSLPNLGTCEGK